MALLALAGLAGCSDELEPPSISPDAAVPPPDAGDEGAAFLGTWRWATGTSTLTCNDGAMDSYPVSGTFTISRGTTSDLVLVDWACTSRFDVDGARATVRPGETCLYYDGTVAITLHFEPFEIMLTGEVTASVRYRGLLNGDDPSSVFPCTDDLNGTVDKISTAAEE